LTRLQRGETTVAAAIEELLPSVTPPTAATCAAQVDLDRARRCGYAEVVYAPGKTSLAIADVFCALLTHGQCCLETRVSAGPAGDLLAAFPEASHNPVARTFRIDAEVPGVVRHGKVAVISAGTSDLPVAEEAVETARWMGCEVELIVDVGVAGPQRLPAQKHR